MYQRRILLQEADKSRFLMPWENGIAEYPFTYTNFSEWAKKEYDVTREDLEVLKGEVELKRLQEEYRILLTSESMYTYGRTLPLIAQEEIWL